MASNLYSAQRNYHFAHNKLSPGNPFNMPSFSSYQQKPQTTAQVAAAKNIFMSNQPPQQTQQKNTLYSKPNANLAGTKFIANMNPTQTMNFQERVITYGQDRDENFFKHTLRKPTSNAIQSTSYNIITGLSNGMNYYGTGTLRYDGGYSQRRDHVVDLLNYTPKTNYGYNPYQNSNSSRTPYSAAQQNQTIPVNQKQQQPNKPVDNLDSIISGVNQQPVSAIPSNNTQVSPQTPIQQTPLQQTPLQQSKTPVKQPTPAQKRKEEYQSKDIPEYYESGATAVVEYAYKEDANARYRGYMEDKGKAVDCFNNQPTDALFCIFDGHGGGEVSKYLQDNIANELRSVLPSPNVESTLISLFDSIDQKIKNSNFFHVGSTACVVYITKENNKRILYCANVGDTRCVLLNQYQAKRLSYDDRASDKNEYNRIINSGGIVFAGRVYGQLMLSRAFGDWELKSYGVINVPHITRIEIEDTDKYIIIGSDGIWDVFEDDDMHKLSATATNADDLCKNIIKTALLRGTMDNISCFVVKLN